MEWPGVREDALTKVRTNYARADSSDCSNGEGEEEGKEKEADKEEQEIRRGRGRQKGGRA